MKLRSPDRRHGIFSARVVFALAVGVFIPLLVYGSAPSWWSQRGVLVSGASANDYAPANQGQLKNIAKAAVAEMDAKLAGGAGQSVHDLVGSWLNPATQPNDFAPVNLGQLKTVAKPFYDRLIAEGLTTGYPWLGAANQPSDFAIANIGQVKQVFSFVFATSADLPLSPRLVAGGTNHTLAIYSDGTVWSWGNNSYGQLGDGTTTSRWHRELVPGLSNIVAVSARGDTSVALRSDGTVWAWGANDEGGVGNGTFDDTPVPSQVMVDTNVPLQNIIAIAAGDSHNLALASDGTVWAWGADWGYQLADVSETDRPFARQVLLGDGTALNGVVSIGCGSNHNFAVKSDGTVWTWGYNGDQELGTGGSDWRYAAPTAVPGMSGVVMASGGETLSVALKADGTVWSWGWPFAGQLGNDSSGAAPAVVGGIGGVTQIACGGAHTLALKNDGTVWAWGWNANGQLGLDPAINSAQVPVQNKQVSGAVGVAAANNQSFAIIADGTLIGWGGNGEGALGRPQLDSHVLTEAVWDFRLRDDPDHDGLATAQEVLLGGNPNAYSTAGDGISDGWKASYGLSLTDTALASRDLSGVGVTVLEAFTGGLDPFSGQKPDPSFYHDGAVVLIKLISPPLQPFLLDGTYQAMIAEARTADGLLARNVPVTFSITQGSGTLVAQPVANPPATTTLTLRTGTDGRVTAYFLPSGAGATAQATIVPPSNGNINGPSGVGGEVLDPNGDDDGDGKSNADELKLGTSPKVFNLFSETHFPGHPEAPHRTSDPMPWQFYTEVLPETPADWAGLTVTARIVFDSFGTVNNWVVDDYATVNGYEFVRLNTKDLVYDVSEYWKSTGNNRFAAVSDATGGIFCASFKLILSVELPGEINPDAGVEGTLGGMVPSILGSGGENHFVSPPNLSGDPSGDYVTFVYTGVTPDEFDRLLKWDTAYGEDVPGAPYKRRVKRDVARKNILRVLTKDGDNEVATLNVWIVSANITAIKKTKQKSPFGGQGGQFAISVGYDFTHTILPSDILTGDHPMLEGVNDTPAPGGTNSCGSPLSGGANRKWDNTRQIRGLISSPFPIACYDNLSSTFSASNVEGDDDVQQTDETNNPYTNAGVLTGSDAPVRRWSNRVGEIGYTVEEDLHFREFSRLLIGNTWYRISGFFYWRADFEFVKLSGGPDGETWDDNGSDSYEEN